MAKEQDQTQDNQDQVIDTTEDDKNTATAVKTSENFDSKVDAEDIDENLSDDGKAKEDDSEDKDTKSNADDTGKTEDKDTGGAETDADDKDKGGEDDALSQNLVDQAIDLGLRTEEIALHKNDAELERTVEILSKIKSAQPKPEDKTQKPAKEDVKEDEGIKFENEEDIDPSILKAVRSLESKLNGENKELRQVVDRLIGSIEQRNQDEFEDRFDGMVKELGTDYEDVFGAGKGTGLNNRSAAHRNRKTMIKRMYAIASGYQAAKERIPTEKELFDQALFALHRKKMNTARSKAISEKGQKQKGRKAGVPASSKTEKPPTGEALAVQHSREFDKLVDTSE